MWSVHVESGDQCMISFMKSAWSATWSVHDQARDQCMISHVIIAWSATWSVHAQSLDQCMISFMIIARSARWSVHAQSRDQCMISFVIISWLSTWSVILPSVLLSIRVFSNEWALHIRWPKYWSFTCTCFFQNRQLLFNSGVSLLPCSVSLNSKSQDRKSTRLNSSHNA